MNTPLDIQEQILLSAWLDGEVSDAERAQVQRLLERPEARAYLDSLKAARVLVQRHGAVKAPVGLKGRVLGALGDDFDDISRPTAERDGRVIAMPAANWRTPLLALAAAIVVVVGLVFGPSLLPTQDERTPTDIAREAVEKAGTRVEDRTGDAGDKRDGSAVTESLTRDKGPTSEAAGKYADKYADKYAEEKQDLRKSDQDNNALKDLPESLRETGGVEMRRARASEAKPEDSAAQGDRAREKELEKGQGSRDDNADPAKTKSAPGTGAAGRNGAHTGRAADQGEDRGALPPAAPLPAPAEAPSPRGMADDDAQDEREEQKKDEAKKESARADGLRKVHPPGNEGGDSRNQEDDRLKNDAKAAKLGGGGGGVAPSARPAPNRDGGVETEKPNQDPAQDAQWRAADTVVELALAPGRVLAAQNDVLRVAALYGAAQLVVSEADGSESIVVDLDAARVAELVATLTRLASQQQYGDVQVPPAMREAVAAAAGAVAGDTARDSLPQDLKVQGAETTESARPAAPERKSRLTIQLK
ncbi:MAG: hypothetical protein HS108_08630 [Planctomycetes bacterium]|nr:hypothetical protein [Planctomycetota bacterium]MCL4730088.1 hypothetical protein [Planctomycetota bacterium]